MPYPHFYCHDHGNTLQIKSYSYGQLEIINKNLMPSYQESNQLDWLSTFAESFKALPNHKKGLLVYVHGYLGDTKLFVQKSGYIIQSNILESPDHGFGMTLSLQWSSPLIYNSAVANALEKGTSFAYILDKIYQIINPGNSNVPIAILAHSMGNRVFQGIYQQWIKLSPNLHMHKVIMVAPDLEDDIFEHAFKKLEDTVGRTYVFHHLNDKTLMMAKAFRNHERLGVKGPVQSVEKLKNKKIQVNNATHIIDDESFGGNLTHHRYYYGSKTIRNMIIMALKEEYE